ncbi:hypothetical protein [Thermostilla marina]
MDSRSVYLERRANGSLLVRVRSGERNGVKLPDAVFTFNCGDPQFEYWAELLQDRESLKLDQVELPC